MDLRSVFESAFPILLEVEGNPTIDILERATSNTIAEDPHRVNPTYSDYNSVSRPYQAVVPTLKAVYSIAEARTDLGDDVINTNTSFYYLRSDLQVAYDTMVENGDSPNFDPETFKVGEHHIVLYGSEYYQIVTGGYLETFGVIELRVMKGN